jgi:hypothetical protein
MNGQWFRSFTAFLEPRRPVAACGPQSTPFPSRVWIVNTTIQALGIEAQRIGNAQHNHLAVFQGDQAVVKVPSRDRNVLAKAQSIVLVYPGVVA